MTYLMNGGLLPVDLVYRMKTILYKPIFVNPQAYDVFPQLYEIYPNTEDYNEKAVFSGTLTVRNVNDDTDYQTFQNTNSIDLTSFAGKLIEIDLQTADGNVALGQWYIKNNSVKYSCILLEDANDLLLESGEPILLEIQ